MLPVAGKPAIFHIIDKVKENGIEDFVIVTGYKRQLIESETLKAYPNLNFEFVQQQQQKGPGHAVFMARDSFNKGEAMLLVFTDTLYHGSLASVLKSEYPVIGVYEVDNPGQFGVIALDEAREFITGFYEKPDNPTSKLAMPGVNYFPEPEKLFNALKYIIENDIKTRNEYHITDAFSYMVKENNIAMKYFKIDGWYDCGTLDAIIDTNRVMLSKAGSRIDGEVSSSEIVEPVYVASGATVENCKLGPYVSVGPGTKIENSSVSYSVFDRDCKIQAATLKDSLIGRRVLVKNYKGTLIAGDDCRLIQNL